MLRAIKWIVIVLALLVVGALLHYWLPQRDIVRITGTYTERQDLADWTRIFWAKPDDQSTGLINRDVQFIQAVKADGKPIVYRNEDTGWGWPPYFKFDTATLQAEAADAISNRNSPEWYALTHYGWRNELLTSFPNAMAIRPVAGPDVRLIPWFNIFLLTFLALFLLFLWRVWRQFHERTVEPLIENATETWDNVEDRALETRGRVRRWFDSLRGR
jgi:hypothetical protein